MTHAIYPNGFCRCKFCSSLVPLEHRARHLETCASYQRQQRLQRMTLTKRNQTLYAVAIQRYDPHSHEWRPEMHYTHAHSTAHARRNFFIHEPKRSHIHVVDIGLAIGLFMTDRDGKALTVD